MTSPQFSGIPTPVAGVTGGQGLPAGVAAVDGSTGNVVIQPPNNVIQQQKGAIPQTFQVYETFTNNSNYIRVSLSASAGGPFRLRTEFAGSGVARPLVLGTGNTDYWQIDNTGNLLAVTTNAYDIGANTGNQVRNIWFTNTLKCFFASGVMGSFMTEVHGNTLWSSAGVPNNANGANGDFCFRLDTPGTANQRLYIKSAGVWVALVV